MRFGLFFLRMRFSCQKTLNKLWVFHWGEMSLVHIDIHVWRDFDAVGLTDHA